MIFVYSYVKTKTNLLTFFILIIIKIKRFIALSSNYGTLETMAVYKISGYLNSSFQDELKIIVSS